MIGYLLKGLIIGFVCGVPIGAAGAMTIQRTIRYGARQGLITGLGASSADCIFAVAGIFGISFISDFLSHNKSLISVAGGIIVMLMGLSMLRKKDIEYKDGGSLKNFITTFMVGITNPVTIVTFMVGFSFFGIQGNQDMISGILAVSGTFLGTYIWWLLLTYISCIAKKKSRCDILEKISKFLSYLLLILGVIMTAKRLIDVILLSA